MTFTRSALRSGRPPRLIAAFVAVLVAASVPAGVGAARRSDAAGPTQPTTDLSPGIQYEEAAAHAADRIEFAAGDRVSVGFRPRVDDAWQVGGHAPRALPAGTAAGRALRTPTREPGLVALGTTFDGAATQPDADLASVDLEGGPAPLAVSATRLRRQVFGFLPYWEVNTATLDFNTLSTIAYFSVGADRNGNLLRTNTDGTTTTGWGGWTSARMTSIINGAHQQGTRVVLTVSMFAWTTTQAATQAAFLGSATARLNLARQAAAAVRARGADGINLDFEPIAAGYADEYTAFVRTVRAELNRLATGYQLTFDTTGSIGNYPIEAATAPGGADAIFIMGYDYRTAGTGYVGSIDPLSGPAYDLADTVAAYAARVPASKLILGVPWYGRAWSTVSDAVNARNQSGTKFGASTSVVYETAVDVAGQYGRRWDSREQSAWVAYQRQNCTTTYGCVTSWRQLYYDDATALKLRYDLVNRTGLRGVGIWALGYDGGRIEMRQALAEKFLNDTTVPLAGIRAMSPGQATEAFAVTWVGSDESGIRDYDVQVSIDGRPWVDWLVDTTAGSATYVGAGGHGFAFRARARDTHLNVSPWNVASVYRPSVSLAVGGFAKVVESSVNVRASAGTTAAIVTTAAAGTTLAITGGPVIADGWTWWKVSLPITEWAPVGGLQTDVWVASTNGTTTLIAPVQSPNATAVSGAATRAEGARFTGFGPVRYLDTRTGAGAVGPLASGAAKTFAVGGHGGVPSTAIAVTGTLTVVGQTSSGFLSLGPSTASVGRTSVLNAPRGDVRATGITVKLGAGGSLAVMWSGSGGSRAHALFDVTGYYAPGSAGATFVPLAGSRLVDTRTGNGLSGVFVNGSPRTFAVAGRGGVPIGAIAVAGNLTLVGSTSNGLVALGTTATATPGWSTLNTLAGDIRAASVTIKLDGSGHLGAVWKGTPGSKTHLIFDVTGYYVNDGSGATFHAVDNARVLDTRYANGLAGPFLRSTPRAFQASGRGTVPVDAVALTGSMTVVVPTSSGLFALGRAATGLGAASAINVPAGDIRANGFVAATGAGGALTGLFASGATGTAPVVVDVSGYFR